ncbi:MAG: peptidylprolyl isomerase [Bacillota bacterium]
MGKKRTAKKKMTRDLRGGGRKWVIPGAVVAILAVALSLWLFTREKAAGNEIVIETPRGSIEIVVYPEIMPVTVANFKKLVGDRFYNGLIFHRVEPWVVQGGDPAGNGTGGPGWTIKLETSPDLKNVRGAVAMARRLEPDTAGSQFYILKKDMPSLDGQYAVFGKVTKGMEVVDAISPGDKMSVVRFK